MKKIVLSITISLAAVNSFAQKSEWEMEGERWAIAAHCMPPNFLKKFKSVGVEYLKLTAGPADGAGIAGSAQRHAQPLVNALSKAECADLKPGLQALHKQRIESLRMMDKIARSLKQ